MLVNLLLQLSHAPFFDHPVESVDSILQALKKQTNYSDELKQTAQIKQLSVCGRIADAHKALRDLFARPKLQFMPFSKVQKNNEAAYINYECALFFRNLCDNINYINHLKIAKLLVKTPVLELLIDYQIATCHPVENTECEQIEKFIDIFKNSNLPVLEVMANFRLAEILAGRENYDRSAQILIEVQQLIARISSNNLKITAQSNLGFVYYLNGDFDQALATFPTIDNCNDYYQRCLILENIALVHEALGDYQTALTFWMESLNIAQDHGVQVTLPEDCIRIGDIQESKLDQPSQAKFFYKLGYDHSMQMFREGVTISGYMKQVIEKYICYFTENYVPEVLHSGRSHPGDPFAFSLNKSWNDVMNLFHYNLIVFHKFKCNSIKDMLKILNLKRSNFQAKQQKLSNLGFHIPDFRKNAFNMDHSNILDELQEYMQKYADLDWHSLNEQFENDILTYFLEKYGTKKEYLMKKLHISYPNISGKLNRLQRK